MGEGEGAWSGGGSQVQVEAEVEVKVESGSGSGRDGKGEVTEVGTYGASSVITWRVLIINVDHRNTRQSKRPALPCPAFLALLGPGRPSTGTTQPGGVCEGTGERGGGGFVTHSRSPALGGTDTSRTTVSHSAASHRNRQR